MRGHTRRFARWALVLIAVPALFVVGGASAAIAGGGCHAPATAASGARVSLSDLCFGPTVLYAKPGAAVTWTNRDSIEHTVTGLGWAWGTQVNLRTGDSYSSRFSKVGIYPYSCILHPGMVGAVVVGNAGSPSSGAEGAAPVPVQTSAPRAAAAAPDRATESKAAGAGPWRLVSFVSLALLVGIVAVLGTVTMQRRGRPATAPGAVN